MTLTDAANKKRAKSITLRFAYCYMCTFIAILFFKNSSAAAEWVTRGLLLCSKRLIPSLFPFMVLSSLAVASGAGTTVFRILAKPFGALFGISADGTSALALGWLCGFPVGAKCAHELFVADKISAREYNTLLCICATPSPAFLIGTVGGGMLGSKSAGAFLYAISLVSSALIGIFLHILHGRADLKQLPKASFERPRAFSEIFTHAISDAGLGMLNICAFVVFFCAFLGALEGLLMPLGLSPVFTALLFGFFELTSGLERICSLSAPNVFALAALTTGWSGLSVHFQTMSICRAQGTKFTPYIAASALKGLLCLILGWIFTP